MQIIALSGKAGAGKTTVADYLVKEFGFKKINFKDALIAEMRVKLPDTLREMGRFYHLTSITWQSRFPDVNTPDEKLIDFLFQDKPPIMRALMQNYGTEVVRAQDPQHWINAWQNKIKEGDKVVVDDCRFLNEADAVKMNGGKIIRVEMIGYVDRLKHSSETEQSQIAIDYLVKSKQGGHSFLYEQIDKIIHEQGTEN